MSYVKRNARTLGGRGASLAAAPTYSNVVFSGAILIWIFNSLANVIRPCGPGDELRIESEVVAGSPAGGCEDSLDWPSRSTWRAHAPRMARLRSLRGPGGTLPGGGVDIAGSQCFQGVHEGLQGAKGELQGR